MIRTVLLENILKCLGKLARSLEDTYHRHPNQPNIKSLEHNQSDEKLILPSALSGSSQLIDCSGKKVRGSISFPAPWCTLPAQQFASPRFWSQKLYFYVNQILMDSSSMKLSTGVLN